LSQFLAPKNNSSANHVARFVSRVTQFLCWNRAVFYCVQETCTRKTYQFDRHTCQFLVPVSVAFVAGIRPPKKSFWLTDCYLRLPAEHIDVYLRYKRVACIACCVLSSEWQEACRYTDDNDVIQSVQLVDKLEATMLLLILHDNAEPVLVWVCTYLCWRNVSLCVVCLFMSRLLVQFTGAAFVCHLHATIILRRHHLACSHVAILLLIPIHTHTFLIPWSTFMSIL